MDTGRLGWGRAMSWNLKGSYVETCSCELMCPCNLSLDHGATYDFCRVTLVFNIQQGAGESAGAQALPRADRPRCRAFLGRPPQGPTESTTSPSGIRCTWADL